jgi:hypothetical protein
LVAEVDRVIGENSYQDVAIGGNEADSLPIPFCAPAIVGLSTLQYPLIAIEGERPLFIQVQKLEIGHVADLIAGT